MPRPADTTDDKRDGKDDKYRGTRDFRWGRCYETANGNYIKMTKTNDLLDGFR